MEAPGREIVKIFWVTWGLGRGEGNVRDQEDPVGEGIEGESNEREI